jgi:hypothetical protein
MGDVAVHHDTLARMKCDGLLVHHKVELTGVAVCDHGIGIDVLGHGGGLARVEGHDMPCVTEAALVFEEEQFPAVVVDTLVSFGDVFEHLLFAMGV